MPNVVGQLGSAADKTLRDLGFTNITFIDEDNPGGPVQTLSQWKVTKQSPAAGTEVPADTPIELEVTDNLGGRG